MIIAASYPYTGNGLGGLPDALEAIVTHEINGQYELFLRYPVTGLHYDELISGRIIMAKPDDLTDEQPFRIYRITKPLNGIVSVYARHLCYDLQGIVVEPFTAGSLTAAFQTIPTKCTPTSPITLQTTRSVASGITLTEPRPMWKLLGGQEGSLLDIYGGEWDFDKDEAKLVTTLGADRGVSIRYGKNMTEMEQDASIEACYSAVYPFWYDEESNTLVNLPEKTVAVTGAVVSNRVMVLDCSDDFDNQPTEQQLRDRANAYITANSIGNVKASWKISFVDTKDLPFDKVMLGDTLHVYYERLDVNATARAVKTEFDVLQGRYKAITVGRVKQNLAAIIVENQEKTESEFAKVKSDLETAVDDATDFIKNGAGYMRFIYNSSDELQEIVSLDDPDITQATKVWRWNNGGFGFSSTGYNGTYDLAITQNGAIVADFITAGTLNANVIRAGILQDALGLNSWNLATGAFTITNGSINITTTSETDDKLVLTYGNYQSTVRAGGFVFGYKNGAVYETRSTLSLDGASYYDFSGNLVARMGLNGPSTSGTGSGLFDAYKENASYVVGFAAHGAGYGEDTTNGICTTYYTNNGFYTNLGNGGGFNQIIDLEAYPQYGYTAFVMKNTSAVSGVGISATSTGGLLDLRDGNGQAKISATASSGAISLTNTNNKIALTAGIYNDQHGYIYLYDGTSNTLRSWYDYTGLKFADSNGTTKAVYHSTGPMTWTTSPSISTSSFALSNCTGTIANVAIQFHVDTDNRIFCISGRVRINNFSRTGSGPGVKLTAYNFGSRSDQPSIYCGIVCNQSGIIPTECVYLQLDYYGNLFIRTTESVVNFSGTAMTMIIPQTFIKY